jgi:hypothetical protein
MQNLTIADADFGVATDRQRAHDDAVRSIHNLDEQARRERGAPRHPFRMLPGRKVLIPGKRKARLHPWASRLLAARTGGVSVDETHPGAGILTMSCYRVDCGDRVEMFVGAGETSEEKAAEEKFREIVRHHSARECVEVSK